MTFEDYLAEAHREADKGNLGGLLTGIMLALGALKKERAATRMAALDDLACLDAPIAGSEPETAYTRAMNPNLRQGGIRPHDGRHIMSTSHWGMV